MKTIGINIDGVVRDFYNQFDKVYRKAFINNPSIVGMNSDMTVKEMTDDDYKILEDKINLMEKQLISLPLDSHDLTNHYKFEQTLSLDGETVLEPEDALSEFLNEKYTFQIYGQADEYEGACDAVNRIQSYGLNNNLYRTVFISSAKSPAIPATFHFLAKNASRIRGVIFVDEDYQKWDYCDIMIDCVPEVIQNVPEGKTIIKIEHPFNQWDEVENSFKSIKDVHPSFLETIISEKEV